MAGRISTREGMLDRSDRLPHGRPITEIASSSARELASATYRQLREQILDWMVFGRQQGTGAITARYVGKGAYGVIFEAFRCCPVTREVRPSEHTGYVAKIVRFGRSAPQESFWNEQTIADRARKNGVPTPYLYYAGVLSGVPPVGVLIMERCTGTLVDLFRKFYSRKTPDQAAALFVYLVEPAIAGILAALRNAGIMHCDLTPQNLMYIETPGKPLFDERLDVLNNPPMVYVVDFGFAAEFNVGLGQAIVRASYYPRNAVYCRGYDAAFASHALNVMMEAYGCDMTLSQFTFGMDVELRQNYWLSYHWGHEWPRAEDYRPR
ncbi:MAG TPA: hypothetical protein VKD22_01865 [Ramlibacter sp.]|nr:hypothetical protein [Ramlibacter sp.]